ncbi:hypothetical protein Tco_0991239 [Tanacetum coccineum]|uniref:Uncharacterized protein n=1 Tax=Tanacetum coccineum TaxID=301880 RepID=A0ABQ5EYY3_9ASTR
MGIKGVARDYDVKMIEDEKEKGTAWSGEVQKGAEREEDEREGRGEEGGTRVGRDGREEKVGGRAKAKNNRGDVGERGGKGTENEVEGGRKGVRGEEGVRRGWRYGRLSGEDPQRVVIQWLVRRGKGAWAEEQKLLSERRGGGYDMRCCDGGGERV